MYNILKFLHFQIQNIKIIGYFLFLIIADVHYIFFKLLKEISKIMDYPPLPLTSTNKMKRKKGKIKGGLDKLTLALSPSFVCMPLLQP
jgi:hypothetical protein